MLYISISINMYISFDLLQSHKLILSLHVCLYVSLFACMHAYKCACAVGQVVASTREQHDIP